LTKAALGHHLQILQVACTSLDREFSSVHNFKKKYESLKLGIKKIYVCQTCDANLINDESGQPFEMQPCGHKFLKVRI
jgi:DNA-directed RNA polymerase subunit RPC12/RpoP